MSRNTRDLPVEDLTISELKKDLDSTEGSIRTFTICLEGAKKRKKQIQERLKRRHLTLINCTVTGGQNENHEINGRVDRRKRSY